MDLRLGLENRVGWKVNVRIWLMWARKIISLLDGIDESS